MVVNCWENISPAVCRLCCCRRRLEWGRGDHQTFRKRQDDVQGDSPQLGRLPQVPRRLSDVQRDPAYWYGSLSSLQLCWVISSRSGTRRPEWWWWWWWSVSFPDCSGKKPLEGPLKEELERALALAERFTEQYNSLMKRFEEKMFNTSSLLDLFNRQFGWVSSLANNTESKDGIFRVQTVRRPSLSNGISFPPTLNTQKLTSRIERINFQHTKLCIKRRRQSISWRVSGSRFDSSWSQWPWIPQLSKNTHALCVSAGPSVAVHFL